ncbi:hypothetical protein T439DRAFT_314947 [Meredithblackwellia eburnea MCA 4105]
MATVIATLNDDPHPARDLKHSSQLLSHLDTDTPPSTSYIARKRRSFADALPSLPTTLTPSASPLSSLRAVGRKARRRLPSFLLSNGEESNPPTPDARDVVLRAFTIAPPHHRENTALHALRDTLPGLPTLADLTPTLPSIFSLSSPSQSQPAPSNLSSSNFVSCTNTSVFDDSDEAPSPPSSPPPPPPLSSSNSEDPIAKLQGNVLVLGGYRGSILRDAKTRKRIWVPLKVGLGIRNPDLSLGLSDEDELNSTDTVIADKMLMAVGGIIDLGKRLKDKLKHLATLPPVQGASGSTEGSSQKKRVNFINFGYDWRRRLELSSAELRSLLERTYLETGEGTLVFAHSMGGLVALHALATASNPKIFKGIVFAGTPFDGCVNIFGPLKLGDGIMFNKGISTPATVFSNRSAAYFLPLHQQCFETPLGESLPIDFFEAENWKKYNISPVVGQSGPGTTTNGEAPLLSMRQIAKGGIGAPNVAEPEHTVEVPLASEAEGNVQFNDEREGEISVPVLVTPTTLNPDGRSHQLELPGERRGSASSSASSGSSPSGSGSSTSGGDSDAESAASSSSEGISDEESARDKENMEYLARNLARAKEFRRQLVDLYDPSKAIDYPPLCILASQKTATVRGVLASSYETIHSNMYEQLLFGAGDGIVCYDSARSLPGPVATPCNTPVGWNSHLKGVVESNFGHVSLLGDLQAVGKCLEKLWN